MSLIHSAIISQSGMYAVLHKFKSVFNPLSVSDRSLKLSY